MARKRTGLELQFPTVAATRPGSARSETVGAIMDAGLRWCWLLLPFRGTRGSIARRPTLREVMEGNGPILPRTTFPFQADVIAGQTIEISFPFTKRPRVYDLDTGEPQEPARRFAITLTLYAPTDRELELMRAWGYDPHNPDWKRFGDELAQRCLIAGRALPANWPS